VPRRLTERQEKYCNLIVMHEKESDFNKAKLYHEAGYRSKTMVAHAAGEIQKPHIKRRLAHLRAIRDGLPIPEDDGIMDDTELEKLLCVHAKNNPGAATKLAEIRLKREAQGVTDDLRPVLFSAFLSDDEIAEYKTQLPADIVVSTGAGEPTKSEGVASE